MAANLLPTPKTKIAKILFALTTGKVISEQQFNINSFRSILSELRRDHRIDIRHVKDISHDEFGRQTWFYKYFVIPSARKKCQKVYNQINK